MSTDTSSYLQNLQALLSMPRETLPQLTAVEARKALGWASEALGLELIEIEGAAPTFLLLPEPGSTPAALFFTTWHAEVLQVAPAAVEGARRGGVLLMEYGRSGSILYRGSNYTVRSVFC